VGLSEAVPLGLSFQNFVDAAIEREVFGNVLPDDRRVSVLIGGVCVLARLKCRDAQRQSAVDEESGVSRIVLLIVPQAVV
jgi:hypothetical protein